MRIEDIFLILTSVGVDLQINSRTVNEEIKLLKKITREIKKECTKLQNQQYKKYFDTIRKVIGEIEDFQKQKKEYVDKHLQSLESDLIDLKTIQELSENLENYKKWKKKLALEKKKKVYNLQKEVMKELSENHKFKKLK